MPAAHTDDDNEAVKVIIVNLISVLYCLQMFCSSYWALYQFLPQYLNTEYIYIYILLHDLNTSLDMGQPVKWPSLKVGYRV